MVQYFSKGKMRQDMTMEGFESRTYILGDAFHTCTNAMGTWMCQQMQIPEMSAEDKVEEKPDDYTVTPDGTKAIAGKTASCWRLTPKAGGYTSRYCYSYDAVPLYVKTETSEGTTEMTATRY